MRNMYNRNFVINRDTVDCRFRLMLYRIVLNSLEGKRQCAIQESSYIIVENRLEKLYGVAVHSAATVKQSTHNFYSIRDNAVIRLTRKGYFKTLRLN